MDTIKHHNGIETLLESLCPDKQLEASEIQAALKAARITRSDTLPHESFTRKSYSRNFVFSNDHVQILVLCWLPGQGSPVHDHGDSNCGVYVVSGVATEAQFDGQHDQPTCVRQLETGNVTANSGEFVHAVSNDHSEPLVTVHVYSPPLVEMHE